MDLKKYEVFTIIPGTLAENEVAPIVERVVSVIQETGVVTVEPQALGKMKIAYPVKHVRYGYFYNFTFEAEPQHAQVIGQKLRIEEGVLRSLIRFAPAVKRNPEAVAAAQRKMDAEMAQEERIEKQPTVKKKTVVEHSAETPVVQSAPAPKEALDMEEIGKKVDKLLEEDFKIDI